MGRLWWRCKSLARWTPARSPLAAQAWPIWDFFGLGSDRASINQAIRYSLDFSAAVLRRTGARPKSPWAVGVRYVYADVDPHLRDEPPFPGLARSSQRENFAPTAILEIRHARQHFTPTRGVYAETSYLASRQALGASVDFERVQQVLIGWMPLRHDITVGCTREYAWSSDQTPFFLRPYIMLRGVPSVRYQEAISLSRWKGVGNSTDGGHRRSAGPARPGPTATIVRLRKVSVAVAWAFAELASKFGLHAGIDVAHGGTTALYFVVWECLVQALMNVEARWRLRQLIAKLESLELRPNHGIWVQRNPGRARLQYLSAMNLYG